MKKIRFVFFATAMSVMLMIPAFAYVDPSVTSMAIQAIAGVVVAAAAVAGVLWSKAKKKAKQVLNIDENAGKTVEEEVVIFDDETKAAVEEARNAAVEVKETIQQVRQKVEDTMIAANTIKKAVICPSCGASTIPDDHGRCEFCGCAVEVTKENAASK